MVKIFVDTANPKEIKEIHESIKKDGGRGLDGVTTNPTSMANYILDEEKNGRHLTPKDVAFEIRDLGIKDISVETLGTPDYNPNNMTSDYFREESLVIHEWGPEFTVKVPMVPEALSVISRYGTFIPYNATLVFSREQGNLAGLAGAKKVSPFIGRLIANGDNGFSIVRDIMDFYKSNNLDIEMLAASIRNEDQFMEAVRISPHIITTPYKVLSHIAPNYLACVQKIEPLYVINKKIKLEYKAPESFFEEAFKHPLLEQGLKMFLEDAKKANYRIL